MWIQGLSPVLCTMALECISKACFSVSRLSLTLKSNLAYRIGVEIAGTNRRNIYIYQIGKIIFSYATIYNINVVLTTVLRERLKCDDCHMFTCSQSVFRSIDRWYYFQGYFIWLVPIVRWECCFRTIDSTATTSVRWFCQYYFAFECRVRDTAMKKINKYQKTTNNF